MAITKTTEIARIEVVGQYKVIQVRTDTVIKEDDKEISRSAHRHIVHPDDDISSEDAEVQAVAMRRSTSSWRRRPEASGRGASSSRWTWTRTRVASTSCGAMQTSCATALNTCRKTAASC